MCSIIGASTSARNTPPILLAAPERLEYRGYDSAGLALIIKTVPLQLLSEKSGEVRDRGIKQRESK